MKNLKIFVETMILYIYIQDYLINRKLKRTSYIKKNLMYIYKSLYCHFFKQINVSVLNKIHNFFEKNAPQCVFNFPFKLNIMQKMFSFTTIKNEI